MALFRTCRVCGEISDPIVKYGVRHYVHPECGFRRWGRAFLDMVATHQIERFPYKAVLAAGIKLEELQRYVAERIQRGEIAKAAPRGRAGLPGKLNQLSYRFPYDSEEARLCGEAARVIAEKGDA